MTLFDRSHRSYYAFSIVAILGLYFYRFSDKSILVQNAISHRSPGAKYNCEYFSRVSTLTRDIDIAILSVCLSVTFRY